jgi:hypothetical protein
MFAIRLPARSWPWLAVPLAISLLSAFACTKTEESPGKPVAVETPAGPSYFKDVTPATGIAFQYRNGESFKPMADLKFNYQNGDDAGHLAILESLGGGVALIDYDGDGLLDIFVPGGGYYDGPEKKEIKGHPCKLYRNLGNGKFQDVTKEAGLDGDWFYTHGAAVADYDNDGWPDLLVTGWHELRLYHNEPVDPRKPNGARKFVDVTKKAGLPDGLWTTSAAWADFDGDGHVDLYVCQYVDWSWNKHPKCSYDGGKTADVCPPKNFFALPHKVFRNNGNGTFTDQSNEAGLRMPRTDEEYRKLTFLKQFAVEETQHSLADATKALNEAKTDDARKSASEQKEAAERELKKLSNDDYGGRYIEELKRADRGSEAEKNKPDRGHDYGKGLGCVAVDLTNDGKPDVYVANDTVDNFLYINCSEKGHIRFKEVGMSSGTARDDRGSPNGSMGVWVADFNRTGLPSLWVANYENEMHALYIHTPSPDRYLFDFGTQMTMIAAIGQAYVGFGTAFTDFDNDGWEDIFVSNGHAIRFPQGKAKRAQKPVLLRNHQHPSYANKPERRAFEDVTRQGGSYCWSNDPGECEHVGRGMAVGDLDNDGRADLVLTPTNQPTAVLRNTCDNGNHWLGIELEGKNHRSVVGAKVTLEVDGQKLTRFALGGGSYLSASDPRLRFGLGQTAQVGTLTVVWPWGEKQVWPAQPIDRYWRLVEGEPAAQVPQGKPATWDKP